jgi:hypothetical protein
MDGSGTADRVDQAAPSPGDSAAGATHTREVDPLTVTQRLQREGRWKDIEPERDEMMRLAKGRFKTKEERQRWVYNELDRLYPPLANAHSDAHLASEADSVNPAGKGNSEKKCTNDHATMSGSGGDNVTPRGGQIQGLGRIPEDWPQLPSNASLSTEIGWVQANRLRIVEERLGAATLVRLDLALSPAPSWAALGWLETSIRSYAKYVDVAAKATSAGDGEAEVWRHERMAIAEVEELINEMRLAEVEAGKPCPRCGRGPEIEPDPAGG